VGRSHDGKFVEIVELPSHPWYVAVQFHPEFKSKPLKPHPLFAGFIAASHEHKIAHRAQAAASVAQ
jgi:CTP synthase